VACGSQDPRASVSAALAAALLERKSQIQLLKLRADKGMIRLNLPRGRAGVKRVRLRHSFLVGEH
jgi:hypothetical protein